MNVTVKDFSEEMWNGRPVKLKLKFIFIPENIIQSFLDFLFKVSIDSKAFNIIHYQQAFQQIRRIQAGNCRMGVIIKKYF